MTSRMSIILSIFRDWKESNRRSSVEIPNLQYIIYVTGTICKVCTIDKRETESPREENGNLSSLGD